MEFSSPKKPHIDEDSSLKITHEKEQHEIAAAALLDDSNYIVPLKCVKQVSDMTQWKRCHAMHDTVSFINEISQAIQGKRTSIEMELSETIQNLLEIFKKLNQMVDEIPPINQPSRFGNKAFSVWYNKLKDTIEEMLKEALPEDCHPAIIELSVYFTESFGNATRIDYGTGHELSFVMFLCCLFKIGALSTANDKIAAGVKVFHEYLTFVRKLQITYRMEPAGSHGVWSLDDFQFVAFIWGSAQLAIHSPFEPKQFLDENVLNRFHTDYIFIGCIDYINKVKTGNFAEHSNQLWSISSVGSWIKINTGLVKMYINEVLGKFPVIQHIPFGKLMDFKSIQMGIQLTSPTLGIMMPPRTPPSHPHHPTTQIPKHSSYDDSVIDKIVNT